MMLQKSTVPHLLLTVALAASAVLLYLPWSDPEIKFTLVLLLQFLFVLSIRFYSPRFSSIFFLTTLLAILFAPMPETLRVYKYFSVLVYVFIAYLVYYFVRSVDEELRGNRNFIQEEQQNLEQEQRRCDDAVTRSKALKEQTLVWHLLSNMLNKSMSLSAFGDIASFFVQQTAKLFPGGAVFFSLQDTAKSPGFTVLEASTREPDLRGKTFDNADALVHASQTPILVPDIASEIQYRVRIDPAFVPAASWACLMAVPVRINETVSGVLKCYHPRSGRFQNTDLRLLQYVGEMQGIQLLNSILLEETERLARTDGITGLFVQYYFVEKIREEIHRAQNSGGTFSLLIIDIDRFKIFNDTYGHLAGDTVLVRTADIIRASIRSSDFPARYGGDEFFLILPETDEAGALALAERIRVRIFEETRDLRFGEMVIDRNVTVSVGVKQYDRADGDWKEFVKKVDDLMYRAKTGGRNRVVGPDHG